jgi:hypothetical protein
MVPGNEVEIIFRVEEHMIASGNGKEQV